MAEVGTGKSGTRFLKTKWPVEEGLTAGTQKQEGRKSKLEAQEDFVSERDKELL